MADDQKYNIFISWSGDRSKAIAENLRDWLPNITDSFSPWMSSEDIAKGSSWKTEIQKQLASCNVGIIVLTPENINAPWVLFEAGAIYKALENSRTCVLLCDLSTPLTGPLGEFQATLFEENDFKQLLRDIIRNIDSTNDTNRIDVRFKKFWSDLNDPVNEIISSGPVKPERPKSREEEMFSEILTSIRSLEHRHNRMAEQIHMQNRGIVFHDEKEIPSRIRRSRPYIPCAIAWQPDVSDFIENLSKSEREEIHQLIPEQLADVGIPPLAKIEGFAIPTKFGLLIADIESTKDGTARVNIKSVLPKLTDK